MAKSSKSSSSSSSSSSPPPPPSSSSSPSPFLPRVLNYLNGHHPFQMLRSAAHREAMEKIRKQEEEKAGQTTFYQALTKDKGNRDVLHLLVFVSAALFLVPVGLFYLFHSFLLAGLSEDDNLLYSAIVSVTSINVILGGFAYYAYYDNPPTEAEAAESLERAVEKQRKYKKNIEQKMYEGIVEKKAEKTMEEEIDDEIEKQRQERERAEAEDREEAEAIMRLTKKNKEESKKKK